MTVPSRRRWRGQDPAQAWKQKSLYIPRPLAERLAEKADRTGKPEKDIIIEALRAKLAARGSKSSDETGDR